MHVLICDDDAGSRLLIGRLALQKLGWTWTECGNGVEALQALGRERFDLAIVDVNMPQIDGVSLVQAIRSSPELRDLRVIMVTSDKRAEVVYRLLQLGITDYVVKPLNIPTLLAKLEKFKKEP